MAGLSTAVSRYLEALQGYADKVSVPGLDLASSPLSLKSVFIELEVEAQHPGDEPRAAVPRDAARSTEPVPKGERDKNPVPEPTSSVLGQHDRVVILGEPGQGKTTLLRHYASALGRGAQRSNQEHARLPILTLLGIQRERTRSIEEPYGWLRERLPPQLRQSLGANGWVELCEFLDSSQACVLLDGFDELGKEAQQEIRGLAEGLKGNQVVLTSRPHAYRVMPLSGYNVFRLRELPELQIGPFAESSCGAIAAGYHLQDYGPALDRVFEVLRGRAIPVASNPLFLSFMCLTAVRRLYEGNIENFPVRPAPLIGDCVDALVAWHRIHKTPSSWPRDLLGARVLRILAPLALETFNDGTGLIKQQALDGLETEDRQIVLEHLVAARFIEQRNNQYGFPLETFREYFAALAIAATSDPAAGVRRHLHDPAWERVVLYAGGSLEKSKASRIDVALPHITPGVRLIHPLAKVAAKLLSDALEKVQPIEAASDVVGVALEMLGPALQDPLERWLARSRRSTEFYVRSILRHRCRYEGLLNRDLRLAARCFSGLAGCPERLVRKLVSGLIRGAGSSHEGEHRAAIAALREAAAGPQVWQVLLRLSHSKRTAVRCAVAEALQGAAAEPDVQIRLRDMQADSENDVRVAAHRSLENEARRRESLRPKVETHSGLQHRILTPFASRPAVAGPRPPISPAADRDVFMVLADPLRPADRGRLFEMTLENDPAARSKAIDKLARAITFPQVQERVLELTRDRQAEVRKAAASAVARLAADPPVCQRLFEMTGDQAPEVCAAAAASLKAAAGDPRVLQRLLELTTQADWSVRAAAASSLDSMAGDARVQRRLRKLARDADGFVRSSAVKAMRGWTGKVPRLLLWRLAYLTRKGRLKGRLLAAADRLDLKQSQVSMFLKPDDWIFSARFAESEADEACATLEVLLQLWERKKSYRADV